eukprot:gene11220-13745_t
MGTSTSPTTSSMYNLFYTSNSQPLSSSPSSSSFITTTESITTETSNNFSDIPCKKNSDFIICFPRDSDGVTAGMVIMAIYSYVPVVVFLVLFGWYIWRRSIVPLVVLISLGICLLLNEAILKNIIKQKRPIESCACSYGMPSGHSLISTFLLFWIIFEFLYDPLVLNSKLSKKQRYVYIGIAIVCFSVVPYSRVYLKYHTVEQIIVGSCLGFVISILVFLFLRLFLMHKFPKKEIKIRSVRILVNSYVKIHKHDGHHDITATVDTSLLEMSNTSRGNGGGQLGNSSSFIVTTSTTTASTGQNLNSSNSSTPTQSTPFIDLEEKLD